MNYDPLVVSKDQAKVIKTKLGFRHASSCKNCVSSSVIENAIGDKERYCTKSFGFHFYTNEKNICDFHKPFDIESGND